VGSDPLEWPLEPVRKPLENAECSNWKGGDAAAIAKALAARECKMKNEEKACP
jgi:hypothetical protein